MEKLYERSAGRLPSEMTSAQRWDQTQCGLSGGCYCSVKMRECVDYKIWNHEGHKGSLRKTWD